MTDSTHKQNGPDISSSKLIDNFYLVWLVIFYINLILGAYGVYASQPDVLFSWSGLLLLVLLGLVCVAYHFIYAAPFHRDDFVWPLSLQRVSIYFIVQTILLGVLLTYNISFIGLGFVFAGQIFSATRPWHWPIPFLAIMAIIAFALGLYDELLQGNWVPLLSFTFTSGIFLTVAILISLLYKQREQLTNLVDELRQAKTELEQYATQAEEVAVLRERNRLAREMHDSIGHALVLINVKLEVAQRLYTRDTERGQAELEVTRELVRETMRDLRHSLADLRAPLFDRHHLPEALVRVGEEIRLRSNLDITCAIMEELPIPPTEVSEALWRIAREALINVERHAAAASATLSLEQQNGAWVLQVIDDGSGIKPGDVARPGHYGIVGMRERVEALGGHLRVAARASGGTMVEATVPIDESG